MTTPTNAEIKAAINLISESDVVRVDPDGFAWINDNASLNETHAKSVLLLLIAAYELLALRTGRHETHWMAPNEPTENMLRHVFMSGASTARILYLLFREAGMEEKEAMRSAAVKGEKDA